MTTRRQFLRGGAAAVASGIAFCGCGMLRSAHALGESRHRIPVMVGGERIKVYGGLLAENWTQAAARDVLASAWLRCDAAGYRPVLSVHDELVFEVPEASAEEDLRRIVGIMEEPVAWAPGLPLRADGKLCSVYGK